MARKGGEWTRAAQLLWQVSPVMASTVSVLTILSGLVPAGVVFFTERLITGMTVSLQSIPSPDLVLPSVAALVTVSVVGFVISVINSYFQGMLQIKLANRVNLDIATKATSLELQHFEAPSTYDSLQRASQEAGSRPYQLFIDALGVLSGLTSLLSVSALLFAWNPWVAVILVISCFPAFATEVIFGRITWKIEHDRASKRRWMTYLQFLTTNDRNVKEVKSFGLGRLLIQRVAAMQDEFYAVDRRVQAREARITGCAGLLNVLVSGVAIGLAAYSSLENGNIGQLAGTIAAVTAVQSGASGLFVGLGQMFEHKLFLSELFTFLDTPHDVLADGFRTVPAELRQGIVFKNVSFTYPGTTEPALSGVSFEAKPGEVLAFVGKNGAGKSTISKLINRLYDPTEGEILLEGHPLSEYRMSELRASVGVAFQDFVQYETNVRENVNYGSVTQLEDVGVARQALERAGADFVDRLPANLETRLGRWFDNSHQLSGGQWQRVAIARALAGDPKVVVLDEPTAAVDSETEARLFSRLREVTQGAICFLVSHRFSTVRVADRILVLENGRVVETGTHAELLAQAGRYASMFEIQAQGYLS